MLLERLFQDEITLLEKKCWRELILECCLAILKSWPRVMELAAIEKYFYNKGSNKIVVSCVQEIQDAVIVA